MKTEPEPIDWGNWGVRSPDDVKAARQAAEMAWIHSPEYSAAMEERVDRDLAHKRELKEIADKHEAFMKPHRVRMAQLDKREMLREIDNELDELKDTVTALADAVKDIAAASCPPETIEKLTDALTKVAAAHSRPRRRVAIRDVEGKIVETHDFADDSIMPGLDVEAKIAQLDATITAAIGILADSMESVAKAVGPKRHIAIRDGGGNIAGTIEVPEEGAA